MYKWHVHSSIGHSRHLDGYLARVADGVAASLRHFSITASRAADEAGSGGSFPITHLCLYTLNIC
jgi:hypothetical protein